MDEVHWNLTGRNLFSKALTKKWTVRKGFLFFSKGSNKKTNKGFQQKTPQPGVGS